MSSSSAPDRSASSATVVELPAPPGWRKKFMPKKSATPGPRMGTVVFISPAGEEIKNKAQLDRYLKAHPGGRSPSDFDWSTGEIPRRSARLGQKVKAGEMPEDEPPAKRARKSRPSKAEVVQAKHDSDIEVEDVGATNKEEPSTEVPPMKEEASPQITEDTIVDRIIEPMPKGDAKCEDVNKDVISAGDEANKKSPEEVPKEEALPQITGDTTVDRIIEPMPKGDAKCEDVNKEVSAGDEANKKSPEEIPKDEPEEAKDPETNVAAEEKVDEAKGPETNGMAETKVEEEKGPETNAVAETMVEEAKSPETNVAAETKVEKKGPETNVASETKVEVDVDKLEKYVVDNAKEHAPSILNNGREEIKDVAAKEGVKEDDNITDGHHEVPKHIVGEADKEPSSASVVPAGASPKTEQKKPGEISTENADPHEKPQESRPKDVPSAP